MSLENLKGTEREGRKMKKQREGLQSQVNWYDKKSSFDLVSVLIVSFIFI